MSARARPKPTPDIALLAVTLALLVLGVEMVYSASFVVAQSEFNDDTYFLSKQVVWAGVALAAMIGTAMIDYHRLERISRPLMLIALGLLVLVLLPGVGNSTYGAQRWIRIIPMLQVQPSEITKLVLIIYISAWLARRGNKVKRLTSGFIPFAMILMIVTALIMKQPDMGTSFVVAVTAACVFFVAGANLLHFMAIGVGGVAGFVYLIAEAGYRQDRIQAFLNPWADPRDTGWHTIQTLIALGSGGVTGLGLGASRQKFYYVPNAHTDAIFAIIGEELGLLGATAVVLLFGLLAWRGFRTAFKAPDPFGRLLATGVTCMIVVQALTNIAVITNTIPYTGITLPFISFGGNSLVVSMAGVGLLLAISRFEGVEVTVSKQQQDAVSAVLRRKPTRPRLAASGVDLSTGRRGRHLRGV